MKHGTLALVCALAFAPPALAQKRSKPAPAPQASVETAPTMYGDAATSAPVPSVRGLTLDKLVTFPEDFEGQSLYLVGVSVDPEIGKYSDVYRIHVRDSVTGMSAYSFNGSNGIMFALPAEMARQIQALELPENRYTCELSFTVVRVPLNGVGVWVASVTQLDFMTRGGTVKHSLTGPVQSAEALTWGLR